MGNDPDWLPSDWLALIIGAVFMGIAIAIIYRGLGLP